MAEYNYTQSVAATTWVIAHNLSVNETINDIFVDNNGNLEKILPLSVVHTSNDILTITFSNTETGYARIIG